MTGKRGNLSLYLDVRKAHLAAKCTKDVYVELPEEAGAAEDECGKLEYWLYGCRPAAQAWEEDYAGLLTSNTFKRLLSSPVVFQHAQKDLLRVVHGDDFIFVGIDDDLDYALKLMQSKYELKNRGRLGSGRSDAREVDMLGRKIKWNEWGLTWEADARHRKLAMQYFGMQENTKALTKNGYKTRAEEGASEGGCTELGPEEKKAFRMLAARLNYLAQDSPVIQFAAKEVCRKMSCPRDEDFVSLKRLVRFIVGIERVEWEYPWQDEECGTELKVFVDSDWAGCCDSRRSTSGGILMLGRHPLRTWSSTQAVVATSSGEAELYAIAEGASRGLGVQSAVKEMGIDNGSLEVRVIIAADSAAAIAFASTRGLGRMRHIEVKDLWIQSVVQSGRVNLVKVRGDKNPADVLTKYLDRAKCLGTLALCGIRVVPVVEDDRAEGGC